MDNNEENEIQISLRILAKTSFVVFIGVILSRLMSYVYRIAIARYFGPEVYGIFVLGTAIIGWVASIAGLGLYEGLIRFIPLHNGKKEPLKTNYLVKFASKMLIVTGMFSGVILFILSDMIAIGIFHDPSLTLFLRILAVSIPLSVMASPFLAMLRGYENIARYSFVFNICQNFVKLAFIGLFILLGVGQAGVPWSYTLGILSLLVLSYMYSKKYTEKIVGKTKNLDEKSRREVRNELLNYSIPLLFFGIVSTLFYWIDSAMIGYFKSSIEVGLYNSATPIAMLLFITYELFSQLFFPMINREYGRKNFNKIKELSKQVSKWVLMINLPALIILFFFPEIIINLLFGSAYVGASRALQILVVGTFVSSLFSISNSLVSMTGKSKIVLMNILIATTINVILNYFFIPAESVFGISNINGINGAALATTISLIILNGLFLIQTWRLVRIIPLRRKMIQIFIGGMLLAVAMLYIRDKFTFTIWSAMSVTIASVILYFVLILIMGALDRNDKHIISSLFEKSKKILKLKGEQKI